MKEIIEVKIRKTIEKLERDNTVGEHFRKEDFINDILKLIIKIYDSPRDKEIL